MQKNFEIGSETIDKPKRGRRLFSAEGYLRTCVTVRSPNRAYIGMWKTAEQYPLITCAPSRFLLQRHTDKSVIMTCRFRQVAKSLDALNRDALFELARRLGVNNMQLPAVVRAAAPVLSKNDEQSIENLELLVTFTLGNLRLQEMVDNIARDPRGQGIVH